MPDTNCIKKRGGGRKRHRRHCGANSAASAEKPRNSASKERKGGFALKLLPKWTLICLIISESPLLTHVPVCVPEGSTNPRTDMNSTGETKGETKELLEYQLRLFVRPSVHPSFLPFRRLRVEELTVKATCSAATEPPPLLFCHQSPFQLRLLREREIGRESNLARRERSRRSRLT